MEVKLTLAEVMSAFDAATELLDAPFALPATAVKVGQIHRTLAPLYEDVARRRSDIVLKYAKRDESDEIVYANEDKTEVVLTPELSEKLREFLSDSTDVTLPVLDAGALDQGGAPSLRPAVLYPLAALFSLPLRKTTVKREDVEAGVNSLARLMGESFAGSGIAPRLARMQASLMKVAGDQGDKRREIATEHAERDEEGNIVYLDEKTQEFAITPAARAEIERYDAEEVEVEIPELRAEDLTLENGKGISPRRIYGLTPFLMA